MTRKPDPSVNWDDNDDLYVLFQEVAHAFRRAREGELKRFGLTYPKGGILFRLYFGENPMTPAELGRLCFREHHNISAVIRRLQEQGLVRKTKDAENRKLVRLALTEKGMEITRRKLVDTQVRKVMSRLTAGERASLRRILDKLQPMAFQYLKELLPEEYK